LDAKAVRKSISLTIEDTEAKVVTCI